MWFILNNYKTPRRPFLESLQFGDNLGNTVFLEAAERLFNAKPINLYDLHDSNDLQEEVKSGDGIILCMANCLSPWWKAEFLINLIKKLDVNILIFSVGIQNYLNNKSSFYLSDDVKTLLSLSASAYPIYVRGEYSSEYLNSIGIKNKIIGCPSIYNAKLITNTTKCKNVVFQCTFHHQKEIDLLKFGIDNNLEYIIQGEKNLSLMSVNKYDNNNNKVSTDLRFFNKLNDVEKHKFKNLLLFPTTLDEWKRMLLSRDFLITTRVHGALLALEVGVLPLLIVVDDRVDELSKYHNIPRISIEDCNFTSVVSLWQIATSQISNFNTSLTFQKEGLEKIVNDIIK